MLLNFTTVHAPFLLQTSMLGDSVLIKVLDNSIALGLLIIVGYFFFKDYQGRLKELDKRLAEQQKEHKETSEAQQTRVLDLMMGMTEAVNGLTTVMKQQQDDSNRRDAEHMQILRDIDSTMRNQKIVFETFMEFNKQQKDK